MPRTISIIGAPSSAGAYSPGQEKTPDALRDAGLADRLRSHGLEVRDRGNTCSFRWSADRDNPRAMNVAKVAAVATQVARSTAETLANGEIALVLGGDCTVEIGTVVGALEASESIGLVYMDFDADMNTPETTSDGALDWMGVAHLLNLPKTRPELSGLGRRRPILAPSSLLLFGAGNVKPAEQKAINRLGIAEIPAAEVDAQPRTAARRAAEWGRQFKHLLVHLDADLIDFEDFPLAEHTRRKTSLKFGKLRKRSTSCFRPRISPRSLLPR